MSLFLGIPFPNYTPSRMELFEIWQQKFGFSSNVKCKHVIEVVLQNISKENISKNYKRKIHRYLHRFCNQLMKRWNSCHRSKQRFLEKNYAWLNKPYNFPIEDLPESQPLSDTSSSSSSLSKADTTKQGETVFPGFYTPEDALALVTEAKLTKEQYTIIRSHAKSKNVDIYPSYHDLTATQFKSRTLFQESNPPSIQLPATTLKTEEEYSLVSDCTLVNVKMEFESNNEVKIEYTSDGEDVVFSQCTGIIPKSEELNSSVSDDSFVELESNAEVKTE